MTNHEEFVAEWNKMFSFKIRTADLLKPTETFLYSALECYLKHLNINIVKLREDCTTEEKRIRFKIKFVQYINHLYKISDASNSFLYYDLLHPGAKKTTHLLKILLNFILYYIMIRDEVVESSMCKIKEYDAIIATKNKFQVANEKAKAQAENMNQKLAELAITIPKLRLSVQQLAADEAELSKDIDHSKEELSRRKFNCLKFEKNVHELQANIVSDSELIVLESSKKSIEAELKEVDAIEQQTLQHNLEVTGRLKEVLSCIDNLKSTTAQLESGALTSSCELSIERDALQMQLDDLEATVLNVLKETATQSEKMVVVKSLLSEKAIQIEQLRDVTEFRALESKRDTMTSQTEAIDQLLDERMVEMDDLEAEREFIDTNGPLVLEKIRSGSA